MHVLLAAEGGYQTFYLHGGEWLILIGSALTALLAVAVGFFLMRGVLAEDAGHRRRCRRSPRRFKKARWRT